MIKVAKVAEPNDFKAKCHTPGQVWLANNVGKKGRPRDLWSPFLAPLEQGFNHLCGYGAMYCVPDRTVDHYVSVKNDRTKAYDWDNYRYASGKMNTAKRNEDARVLDPYEVEDGWFEIILPSLQMVATAKVPASVKARAEHTLTKMGLRDGESVIRWRRGWYDRYERHGMSLDELRRAAPLIAEAVDRRIAAGALR